MGHRLFCSQLATKPQIDLKQKRCPKGTRKNPKSGACESKPAMTTTRSPVKSPSHTIIYLMDLTIEMVHYSKSV